MFHWKKLVFANIQECLKKKERKREYMLWHPALPKFYPLLFVIFQFTSKKRVTKYVTATLVEVILFSPHNTF